MNTKLAPIARNKNTKIVATIGPATQALPVMKELIKYGMNVVRMNFSHGDLSAHKETLTNARQAAKEMNTRIAILQDLCGPKIRVAEMKDGGAILKKGAKVIVTTKTVEGNEKLIPVNYKKLAKEVKKGQSILIEDGRKHLEVISTNKKDTITCKVLVGGMVKSRKGINLPGAKLTISSLTPKDKTDLEFGIKNKVDYVAISFVKTAKDILDLKKILKKANSEAHIIAKIETTEAIENFEEILKVVDGIMVARGDLGVEIGHAKVPLLQKMMIQECMDAGKPVIVATQMLDSMEDSPVPTRAEASDVANSIMDGADAVMLSGETSIGSYPVDAVKIMSSIAAECEGVTEYADDQFDTATITGSFGKAAIDVAFTLGASLLATLTTTGFTARLISRYRPDQKIVAFTYSDISLGHLQLLRGVHGVLIKKPKNLEAAIKTMNEVIIAENLAKKGDLIVATAAGNPGNPGSTNFLHCFMVSK